MRKNFVWQNHSSFRPRNLGNAMLVKGVFGDEDSTSHSMLVHDLIAIEIRILLRKLTK